MYGSKSSLTIVIMTILIVMTAFHSSLYAGKNRTDIQKVLFGTKYRGISFSTKVLSPQNAESPGLSDLAKGMNDNVDICNGWFSYDKGYHVLGSFMLTVATSKAIEQYSDKDEHSARVWAASITVAFGLSKEIYDSTRPLNHFSYKDFIADLIGITLGLVLLNND